MPRSVRRPSPLIAQLRAARVPGARRSLADDLRRAILGGGVAPGTPIPVGAVAELYRVSAIPVREALHLLVGERLVEHRPHAGYRVARVTRTELRELYVVRAALEAAALQVAVPASPGERAQARTALALLDDAVAAGDVRAYHLHSRTFHLAVVAPCRMSRLLHMLESAWNVTEPVQPMRLVPDAERLRLHGDHRAMYAAFAAGDVERLLAAARVHAERLERAVGALPEDI